MQVKRITCPSCKVVMDVRNATDEPVKIITCPKCKARMQVKFAPRQEPLEAHTCYAGLKPAVSDGETQLAGAVSGATQLATPRHRRSEIPCLLYDGNSYPLEEGRNVIGRKGKTSEATVQIATADHYMSRQHCVITVTALPDGTWKMVLANYQNKNVTTVDGQTVSGDDKIRLSHGSQIKMGNTTVVVKL